MTTILQLDSSARPSGSDVATHGSHTRRLTGHFVKQWKRICPADDFLYRDVGTFPPNPVTGPWVHAAFTKPETRENWMHEVLRESDELVNELVTADIIVAGVPMYNFSVPAQFKAYIDNIVRVGRTFGFDRSRKGEPYWPLLSGDDKTLVLLSSRGDYDYDEGRRLAHKNHVERSVRTAFEYIGITDVHCVAVEYDEFGDERLHASLAKAETNIDRLVQDLAGARRKDDMHRVNEIKSSHDDKEFLKSSSDGPTS